jgi:hypothetical protein
VGSKQTKVKVWETLLVSRCVDSDLQAVRHGRGAALQGHDVHSYGCAAYSFTESMCIACWSDLHLRLQSVHTHAHAPASSPELWAKVLIPADGMNPDSTWPASKTPPMSCVPKHRPP